MMCNDLSVDNKIHIVCKQGQPRVAQLRAAVVVKTSSTTAVWCAEKDGTIRLRDAVSGAEFRDGTIEAVRGEAERGAGTVQEFCWAFVQVPTNTVTASGGFSVVGGQEGSVWVGTSKGLIRVYEPCRPWRRLGTLAGHQVRPCLPL
jgi:hypothetical protein